LTDRQRREFELKSMLANHEGRNQLTKLLRQYLNIPTGQLPRDTPFIDTILAHEFAKDQPAISV
jgi:hypothetical protein